MPEGAKSFGRELRLTQTDAEARLWYFVRNRNLAGARFRRQQRIGGYYVDFYCAEEKLVVEVDGSQHLDDDGLAKDAVRTAFLESKGLRVLRFDNRQVLLEGDGVREVILQALARPSP